MFITVLSLKYAFWEVNDHVDIFLKLVKFYLNNMVKLHPLTPHITPSYSHKMENVS